ncbi:MAG: prepilin-type N-terminal cleavage/methylation domain-containing protein [Verrucomicrobiaceae bacterium]|jgi:prepilin-type N-terminal cleavage/methylation domain-containing protein|nr:MAG: prepilin-type N-terminal cleavage/methylation domain-containing protein [Verrucomicrobiaceae bacterium]
MRTRPARLRRTGFTLLELVIAMGLLAIIVGMVFGIARTSLALGNTIVATQNEEMERQAFFELLSRRFSSLPGNTRLELKVEDSGAHYLSDLTLQNVPLAFTWGGQERIAKAVQLSTVRRRSGFLDIVLRYYENEILEGSESTFGQSALDKEPFAEIVLLTDVAYFEWRALDGRSLEWQYDWEIQGSLPLQLELVMAVGAKGEEIRQVFWLPPKLNPDTFIGQTLKQHMMQNSGQGAPPGNAPGGENGGPQINIPTGNLPGGTPPQ